MDNYSDFDVTDDWRTLDYQNACVEVAKAVRAAKKISIGALSRLFPQWRPKLIAILEDLKSDGAVKYDDYKPAPTIIEPGAMGARRVLGDRVWDNGQLFKKP